MPTFSHDLTDDEAAAIGDIAPGQSWSGWLAVNIRSLVGQALAARRARRAAMAGLSGDPKALGLTDAEVEAVLAPREAAISAKLAAATWTSDPG